MATTLTQRAADLRALASAPGDDYLARAREYVDPSWPDTLAAILLHKLVDRLDVLRAQKEVERPDAEYIALLEQDIADVTGRLVSHRDSVIEPAPRGAA